MFQLIYVSTAARRLRKEEFRALVDRARENNDRLGVTGVLVYRNGSFLHVLEGDDEDTVRQLYEVIRQDDRHKGVTLLKASSLAERNFPGQSLVFRNRSVAGARQHPLDDEEAREEASKEALASERSLVYETLLQFQHAGAQSAPQEPASPPEGEEETTGRDASASGSANSGNEAAVS